MNISKQQFTCSRTLIALAVLAAFGPAYAEDEAAPATVSSVSVGVGVASGDSKDRARFGLYNGLRNDDVNGLVGFQYINRDNASGRWTAIEGNNLGLDSREVGLSVRQLGDWKFNADYSEITRHDPRTINTGDTGLGSTTPTVRLLGAPGTGNDVDLKLKRKAITLSGAKWLGGSLQFEASFKNEDKDGARLWGKGFACASATAPGCGGPTATATGWALLLLPEPINSNIKQAEARLNFSGEKFLVSGGYYGSFYTNSNGSLSPTVPGTLNNALGNPLPLSAGLQNILALPMALPPDNQAHQVYVSGNYRFTTRTAGTFKAAYTHATQNEDFASMNPAFAAAAPAGRTNLGGVMDTTLLQAGLTTRPIDKFNVVANVRYEDRKNKTPIALYNLEGVNRFTNGNPSPKKLNAKLDGTYQLPYNYRATLGTFYESVNHGSVTPTDNIAGISGLRQKTEEWGYRGELRRPISETLTGALGYERSFRHGNSSWLRLNPLPATGVTEVSDTAIFSRTAIFPFIMEDRTRDMLKLSAYWSPMERLSLQFFAQGGHDRFGAPTTKGLRDTSAHMYSVDAAYTLTEAWKATAYWSRSEQSLRVDHSTGYQADLRDISDAMGLGLSGKPTERLQLGGDLSWINEKNVYDQTLDPLASATNQAFLASSGGLPDVTYRLLKLRLFGDYAVQKNASVRLNVIHYRDRLNEWTWGNNGVPFAYSDNTTVTSKTSQNVTFVGLSWIYRFQ